MEARNTRMGLKPIHQMRFSAFADAIEPMGGRGCARGAITPRDRAAWLASLWSSADVHVSYSVYWRQNLLIRSLPPDAHEYQFEDVELRAPISALALNPESEEDTQKVAELLAARNAWLAAVVQQGQKRASEGRYERFCPDVADDYVLLSCQWTAHPWIQHKVREYRDEKARKQARLSAIVPEFSSDPRWPDTQVVCIESGPLSPAEEEAYQAERESIAYWLNYFDTENRGWSSAFAIYAWDAADDIELANSKIEALQELIDAQQAHIQHLEQVVRENKRRDAELSRGHGMRGRPQLLPERKAIAHKFTAKWVKSLMAMFEVDSTLRLEDMVSGSSQRNWRRWVSGEAVPTLTTLVALQTEKVARGRYKGKSLKNLATTPTYDDLLKLVKLTGMAKKAS